MIAFGHTAVGAAVGLEVYHIVGSAHPFPGLIMAGTAGLVSHYLADLIPHGHFFVTRNSNYFRNITLTLLFDLLLGVIIFTSVPFMAEGLGWKFWYVLFGIGGAQLPDILDHFIHLGILPRKGIFKFENSYHQETHWHGKHENALLLGWYDIWQLTTICASLAWLIYGIS